MKIFPIIFFLGLNFNFAQDNYSVFSIPENLKENANSTIRNQEIEIDIISINKMVIKTQKVITVFNYSGLKNIDAHEFYDKSTTVNSIQAVVYDALGNEIKKIKRKDFKDQSVADGFSIYTDNRILFLEYTPVSYPFTIVYESETTTQNTAFIPNWFPVDDYNESVQKSTLVINYPPDLGFKFQENNFSNNIQKQQQDTSILFIAENIPAEKPEDYSPLFKKTTPNVIFGLEKFNLEGYKGSANTWKDLGEWVNNNLLFDTKQLDETTKQKVQEITKNEKSNIDKAKKIYQYLQENTRYISIQLGIGGWKPMLAKDVNRLGYGDCKALVNYTQALLKEAGIESYYTIIYGNKNKKSIEKDFVSEQGNHIILTIPNGNETVFLECTNQNIPFGYLGESTDDRYAFVIKENASEIIKTKEYTDKENLQTSNSIGTIDENGNLKLTLTTLSEGINYGKKYGLLSMSKQELENYYKESEFNWINNLKLTDIKFKNDKENITFKEEISFEALNFIENNNGKWFVPINITNRITSIPARYRSRKKPIEIERGFIDTDTIEILFPKGTKIQTLSDDVVIDSKFGVYKLKIIKKNDNSLLVTRFFNLHKGFYPNIEYDNFRKFIEDIVTADNSKIIVSKNNP